MEEGEAGFGEGDGRGAGEVLGGEVEEGKGAESCRVGVGGGVEAGDLGGYDEVLAVDVEGELGVGAGGHLEVEGDVVIAEAEVEDAGGVGWGEGGLGDGDGVRELCGVGVETEVGEGGGGVGEDGGVKDGAGLRRRGRWNDGAGVGEVAGAGGVGGLDEEGDEQEVSHPRASYGRRLGTVKYSERQWWRCGGAVQNGPVLEWFGKDVAGWQLRSPSTLRRFATYSLRMTSALC